MNRIKRTAIMGLFCAFLAFNGLGFSVQAGGLNRDLAPEVSRATIKSYLEKVHDPALRIGKTTLSLVEKKTFSKSRWVFFKEETTVVAKVPVTVAYGFPTSWRRGDLDVSLDYAKERVLIRTAYPAVLSVNVRVDQATFRNISENKAVSDEHIQKMMNDIYAKAEREAARLIGLQFIHEKAATALINWYRGFAEEIAPGQLRHDDFNVVFCDGS